jgi:ankyrin repeat protein
VDHACNDGRVPLHAALQYSFTSQLAEYLMNQSARQMADSLGRNCAYFAAIYGHSNIWYNMLTGEKEVVKVTSEDKMVAVSGSGYQNVQYSVTQIKNVGK